MSITYEQPLNERIRTCLRLEFLFEQASHAMLGQGATDSRNTLSCLIDTLNVLNRGDLKAEFIKELERLETVLSRLTQSPGVDQRRLAKILEELHSLRDQMLATSGLIGQELRNNELLNCVRQRSSIPGGTCDFDLPYYHYWLERPHRERTQDMQTWLAELAPIRQSTDLILHLIRESSLPSQEIAASGLLNKSLVQTTPPCQLIRVTVPASLGYYPEISAGKHRFSVRFMQLHMDRRPTQSPDDITFELTCCAL
ncbi:MAG: hypothetical protein A2V90_06980 [Gammaproteobacteria bacterium RBG_16_57_12]|nr:MAG: hypothetical protein A2V90_06980 [Gammaproteobacteria bacterium RBG_16_57_12]